MNWKKEKRLEQRLTSFGIPSVEMRPFFSGNDRRLSAINGEFA